MKFANITDQLNNFSHVELLTLADWCKAESSRRDPVKIALDKQLAESFAKYQAEQDRKNAEERAWVVKLKAFIKPGMKLKMMGCKDGLGLREFIKWENDQLVCWQIKRVRRGWQSAGTSVVEEINTNFVTTHMANKVSRIFVDGTGIQVKNIIK